MIDLLLTIVVLCLLVAGACALGLVVVVLPFVLAMDIAERRGFAPVRWGAASLAGTALMIATIAWLLSSDHPRPLLLPALAVGVLSPVVVALLDPGQETFGGRPGAHQR